MSAHSDLIEHLHGLTHDHVHLAVLAEAVSVAEMHIDLAVFCEEQSRVADQLFNDG